MNNLCLRGKQRAIEELAQVEDFLIEKTATKNANIIKEHVKSMENDDGKFNQLKLWKLKRKVLLYPVFLYN